MTAEALYEAYLSPPWSEPGRREREFLDAGEPLLASTEYGKVRGRLWRTARASQGSVLLAHGWAGRSATWLVLVPLLNEAGFDAIAFDAPGHGETRGPEGSPRSHFFAFAATLMAAQAGDLSFRAVIGHSFGGCAIPYALARGLRAERAVLIAPTARTESFLVRWARSQGLSSEDEAAVHRLWLVEFGESVLHETDPVAQAREMTIPALVLHDEGDVEAPVEDGRALAEVWPGAGFETTTALGHRRILLARAAMSRVVAFVAAPLPMTADAVRTGFHHSDVTDRADATFLKQRKGTSRQS